MITCDASRCGLLLSTMSARNVKIEKNARDIFYIIQDRLTVHVVPKFNIPPLLSACLPGFEKNENPLRGSWAGFYNEPTTQ